MKVILAVLCTALLIPAVVHAQAPPVGSFAIYANEARTTWCTSGTPPYLVDMWIDLTIGENGAFGYSFDIAVPPNVVVIDMVLNRYELPSECLPPDCETGISGTFGPCFLPPLFTSIWIVHATLQVLDATPSVVGIIENPVNGSILVQNCDLGYEMPGVLNELYVNYAESSPECGAVPTETSTWGAIKTLYQ